MPKNQNNRLSLWTDDYKFVGVFSVEDPPNEHLTGYDLVLQGSNQRWLREHIRQCLWSKAKFRISAIASDDKEKVQFDTNTYTVKGMVVTANGKPVGHVESITDEPKLIHLMLKKGSNA